MYVLLSSDSDLHFLGQLIARAGFRARIATAFSIIIESMIIYELTPLEMAPVTGSRLDRDIDDFVGQQEARTDLDRVRA
jgi:hypothetical protein